MKKLLCIIALALVMLTAARKNFNLSSMLNLRFCKLKVGSVIRMII